MKEMEYYHIFLNRRKSLKRSLNSIGQLHPFQLRILPRNGFQKLFPRKLDRIFSEPVGAHISCDPVQIGLEFLLLHIGIQIPQKI